MELNRRDLMKFFGIGATIVPVLGGVPKVEMPAKLIAEPRLEPVALAEASSVDALMREATRYPPKLFRIKVNVFSGEGNYQFEANSFITGMCLSLVDVSMPGSPYCGYYPGLRQVSWTLKGVVSGDIDQILTPR